MLAKGYNLHLIDAGDLLARLRVFIKLARQNANLTQSDLARKAGVPATTLSRLERTGLASTDAVARVLFALNELDAVEALFAGRVRQLTALAGDAAPRQRVRHGKEDA